MWNRYFHYASRDYARWGLLTSTWQFWNSNKFRNASPINSENSPNPRNYIDQTRINSRAIYMTSMSSCLWDAINKVFCLMSYASGNSLMSDFPHVEALWWWCTYEYFMIKFRRRHKILIRRWACIKFESEFFCAALGSSWHFNDKQIFIKSSCAALFAPIRNRANRWCFFVR